MKIPRRNRAADASVPSRDEVTAALRSVEDPQFHRSIVELDLVRDAVSDRGQLRVVIALPAADAPTNGELTERVTAALSPLEGVRSVQVDFTVMTDDERSALRERLRPPAVAHENAGQAGHGHAAGPKTAPPFMQQGSKTRVLAISSGKGGVGKSSTTVNLAIALSRQGYQVGVLDADVYGFSIPKMLGIDHEPVVLDDMIVPPVAHGVSCISIGFFADEDTPIIWRGPMLHKALEQFLTDVHWGEPDFFLIDMPPGTGDVALSIAQYLPRAEVYVVTTPQPAAQRVAQRSAAMASKVNLPLFGVIENMSWFTGDDGKRYEIFGSGGGKELADKLAVPLVGRVPLVPELREGGDVGLPITVSEPDGEAAQAFARMARHIADNGPKRRYRRELTVR